MLAANSDMRRVVSELMDAGRITQTLADYARAQGYSDQDIIAARERVRLSSASLAIQGAPLRHRPAPAPVADGEPTHERVRKGGQDYGRRDPFTRRYQFRSVMDVHADKFLMSHRTAFQTFVGDAELHQRIRVADMNSNGGSSHGRLGGLGNVPDKIRDRHTRYEWISKALSSMERQVCDALVLHCLHNRDGSPLSPVEYGRLIFPKVKSEDFLRGAAIMGFMHLVDRLAELYHHPTCPRIRSNNLMLAGVA